MFLFTGRDRGKNNAKSALQDEQERTDRLLQHFALTFPSSTGEEGGEEGSKEIQPGDYVTLREHPLVHPEYAGCVTLSKRQVNSIAWAIERKDSSLRPRGSEDPMREDAPESDDSLRSLESDLRPLLGTAQDLVLAVIDESGSVSVMICDSRLFCPIPLERLAQCEAFLSASLREFASDASLQSLPKGVPFPRRGDLVRPRKHIVITSERHHGKFSSLSGGTIKHFIAPMILIGRNPKSGRFIIEGFTADETGTVHETVVRQEVRGCYLSPILRD